MSGKYHDRFSEAITELETHNGFICLSCKTSLKSHDHDTEKQKRDDTHAHKKG